MYQFIHITYLSCIISIVPFQQNNHPQEVSLLGRCIWNNYQPEPVTLDGGEFHKYAAVIVHPWLFWVKKGDEILPKYKANAYVCMNILDIYMINYMFYLEIDISLPL